MKNIFSFIFFLLIAFSSSSQIILLKDNKHNFGFITEGDTVKMDFSVENKGDQALIITEYKVECHCTYLKELPPPILPGERIILTAYFDTHQKYDRQERSLTLISNAINGPVSFRFKGVVRAGKRKK